MQTSERAPEVSRTLSRCFCRQLKARHPGMYAVTLAPGRATELYSILNTSNSGASSGGGYQNQHFSSAVPADAGAVGGDRLEVAVRDFTGPITQLSVSFCS